MGLRRVAVWSSVVPAFIVMGVGSVAWAQSSAVEDWGPPRLANGRPDLQGVWLSNTAAPVERPADLADRVEFTDAEVAGLQARAERIFADGRSAFTTPEGAFRAALRDIDVYEGASSTSSSIGMVDLQFINRTSLVIEPANGRIPAMTEAGQARTRAVDVGWELKTGPEDLNSFHRCVTTGVPRLGGNFGAGPYTFYQLIQTPDHVAFISEAFHDARLIPLDGRFRLPHSIRQWNGSSRGRWEDDTLVVESSNFSPNSDFRGSAGGLQLIERFTRTGPDTLHYRIEVRDPSTWAAAWAAEFPLVRREQPLYEFACHEGNVSMEGMLRTARLEDRQR